MIHRRVRELLYDYTLLELDMDARETIRRHLSVCKKCSMEHEAIKKLMLQISQKENNPAARLDDAYWSSFQSRVLSKMAEANDGSSSWVHIRRYVSDNLRTRPRLVVALGGLALLVTLYLLWPPINSPMEPDTPGEKPPGSMRLTAASSEISDYFRRSRALLVGISNLEPSAEASMDLSDERKLSRQLVSQAEELRTGNLDPRFSRLIGDLDRILVRVTTAEGADQEPQVNTIRAEIRRQNLLLKLRIAESAHSGIPVVTASDKK